MLAHLAFEEGGTNSVAAQDREQPPVSVFMGVPTMYSYLLSAYDAMSSTEQAAARCAAFAFRAELKAMLLLV